MMPAHIFHDDGSRYIRCADIHSHNSMEAFFCGEDDRSRRTAQLHVVLAVWTVFSDTSVRMYCGPCLLFRLQTPDGMPQFLRFLLLCYGKASFSRTAVKEKPFFAANFSV